MGKSWWYKWVVNWRKRVAYCWEPRRERYQIEWERKEYQSTNFFKSYWIWLLSWLDLINADYVRALLQIKIWLRYGSLPWYESQPNKECHNRATNNMHCVKKREWLHWWEWVGSQWNNFRVLGVKCFKATFKTFNF